MGWFWGRSHSSDQLDPARNLDPSLQEYLQKESPATYSPTTAVPSSRTHGSSENNKQRTSFFPKSLPAPSEEPPAEQTKPIVPSQSLFPDGRYAHLWKEYKPISEVEGLGFSPAEKVIDQYKRRKDVLNRAALENCAEEHITLSTCFKNGNLADRVVARATMCRAENRTFSRCYEMQAKFLQALGYGSDFQWDSEKEERIQMHADKLYHQMLDYERQVEEAKAAGVEPPPVKSLFNPGAEVWRSTADAAALSDQQIPGGGQIPPRLRESLKDLSPHERELELQAIKQKTVQREVYLTEVSGVLKADDAARAKRQEKFVGWFGETVGKWLA